MAGEMRCRDNGAVTDDTREGRAERTRARREERTRDAREPRTRAGDRSSAAPDEPAWQVTPPPGWRPRPPALVVPGTLANTLLRSTLAAITAVSVLATLLRLAPTYPLAVDIEIPLRAADRWLHGGQPYLASSFAVTSGPGQPFLYPPFVLPFVAPFATLPLEPVAIAWGALSLGAAVWTLRRLGMPAWTWPLALAWAPYLQPLLGLNVQVLLFAAFVALLVDRPGQAPSAPDGASILARVRPIRDRDVSADHSAPETAAEVRPRPALVDGVLGVFIALLKTSQVHPWVYLLRRRPKAGVLGVIAAVSLVLVTLPLTGLPIWFDWLAQARRAAQPGLSVGGISLLHFLPFPLAVAGGLLSVLLVFAVPRRHAAAWVGLLTLIGSPDLHFFGLLFAIPAMLIVRREIALAAALAISTYTTLGAWLGVVLVLAALASSYAHPALLELVGEVGQYADHVAGSIRRVLPVARPSRRR